MNEEASSDLLGATTRGLVGGQKLFKRYTLNRVLGRGGMGVVWLARDDQLERDVALKFLPEAIILDRALLGDLKRETKRSLELTHRNIVRIYDFVNDETSGCISMEYIDGDTLSNMRADRERKVFETRELPEWMKQLCDALDYAHNHVRVVHHDLKPSNLMVTQRGDLKVADFGIARSLSDSMSVLSMGARGTSGTLVYMSPQQLDGERASQLDDIYSLGATLYELLTSKPPFYSGNIDRQIHERIPPRMGSRREELEVSGEPIDETWEKLVAACLQKDPARRPQSVLEVANRLTTLSTVKAAPRPKQASKKRFQRAGLAMLGAGKAMGRRVALGADVAKKNFRDRGRGFMTAGNALLRGTAAVLLAASKETLRATAFTAIPAALVAICIWYFAIRPPPRKVVQQPIPRTLPSQPPPRAGSPSPNISGGTPNAPAVLGSSEVAAGQTVHMKGVDVNLPTGVSGETWTLSDYVSVSVDLNGNPFFDKEEMNYDTLTARLKTVHDENPEAKVFVRGDVGTVHGNIIKILDILRSVGFYKIAFEIKNQAAKTSPTPIVEESRAPTEVTSTPQLAKSVYRPSGQRALASIASHASSSVDAIGTPLGRYQKLVHDAIGSRWYWHIAEHGDLISTGTARMSFSIDPSGRVKNLKVVQNSSNESFANVCLQSIVEIKLPPIPKEVAAKLPPQGLAEDMSFTMSPSDSATKSATSPTPPPKSAETVAVIGIRVDLPPALPPPSAVNDYVAIQVAEGNAVYFDGQYVSTDQVLPRLFALHQTNPGTKVSISATMLALHGDVIAVLDKVHNAGITKVIYEIRASHGPSVTQSATLNIASITRERPYVNSLAMKFVPVPGTNVLFSIWDTRVRDYKVFAEATKRGWGTVNFGQTEEHPAIAVTWDDATAFCEWLTEQERKTERLTAKQAYRLPTDSEWSAAVGLERESGSTPKERDGKVKGVYPWGTTWPPPTGAGNYFPTFKVDNFKWTSPVGSFEANRYGLYDLGGNVWEWCEDWYDGEKKDRVLRGASFFNVKPDLLLSSARLNRAPRIGAADFGFRCVLSESEVASAKNERASVPLESPSPGAMPGETGAETPQNPDTSPVAPVTGSNVKILSAPQPAFPRELDAKHIGGSGRFVINFDESGNAESVQIVQSTGNRTLDSNTVHTLTQWRAAPGAKGKIVVPVTYTIPKPTSPPAAVIHAESLEAAAEKAGITSPLTPPRPAQLRRCRIIRLGQGELLIVRKGPGLNFPAVARYSFHQNDLIRAGEGPGQRTSNAGTNWQTLYSERGRFIGWVEEGHLSQ